MVLTISLYQDAHDLEKVTKWGAATCPTNYKYNEYQTWITIIKFLSDQRLVFKFYCVAYTI